MDAPVPEATVERVNSSAKPRPRSSNQKQPAAD